MRPKKYLKGARPIQDREVKQLYTYDIPAVSLSEYENVWRDWINYGDLNYLGGLDDFKYAHYTQGTSQTFDNFILRHAKDRCIVTVQGEFQYHRCLGKHVEFKELTHIHPDFIYGKDLHALIISAPFSDFGCLHPEFDVLMDLCEQFDIPVCLDLAYWGVSKNINIDLEDFKCIKEVTLSLSKPFYTLENHRVGIRFTRDYVDDGITMINDVNYQNKLSMALGVHYMTHFAPDFMWNKYKDKYEQVCHNEDLIYTDTVLFGLGDKERHSEFWRGTPNNYRVCVSDFLGDVNDS